MKKLLFSCLLLIVAADFSVAQNIGINTTGLAPTTPSMLEIKQPSNTTNTIGFYVEHTGATAGNTYYALQAITNGAGLNKIAAYLSATGGTNNYALIVPSGGGYVGIGTSTPQYTLDVTAPAGTWKAIFQGTDGNITIGPANAGWAHIYTDRPNFIFNVPVWSIGNAFSSYNTGDLYLQTNGTTRIFARNTDGFVGIATTGPAAKFHVAGGGAIIGTNGTSSNTRTLTILEDGDAQTNFGSYPGAWTSALQIQDNTTGRYLWLSPLDNASGANARLLSYNTGLDFYTGANAYAATIASNGNVGINNAAPGYKFTVTGGAIGGNYGLLPNYAGWSAYGTGDGGAAIYNDNGTYQTLMLVGNNSAGGVRRVSVWDYLTVNGNSTITGLAGVGTRMIQANASGVLASLAGGTTSQVLLGDGTWGSVPAGSGNYIQNQFAGAQTADHWVSGSSRATEVYSASWFRNDASGTGLYNQTNGRHFYSDGASYWSLTTGNGLIFRDAYASTIQGYIYNDGTNFGILHRGGGWGIGTSTTRAFVNQYLMVNGSGAPSYALHVLGDVYANGGWLRVSGNQGLYWESWGPGWYVQDGTWLRTYNNASIWANTGTIATNGSFSCGYGGAGGPSGGGIFSGKVGIGLSSPDANSFLDVKGISSFGDWGGCASDKRISIGWYNGCEPLIEPRAANWGYVGTASLYFYQMYSRDYNAAGDYWYFSDESIKENIRPIPSALDKVLRMKGVVYDIKEDSYLFDNKDRERNYDRIGFIAQDFQKILPRAVKEVEQEVSATSAGEVKKIDGTKLLTVSYSTAIPVLVEAMKEQQVIIESLKKQIEEQNERVKVLEKR